MLACLREGQVQTITYINCFEIPSGKEEDFFRAFEQVNAYMRGKPGYLGHKMHRALTGDASFRFVNVVHWASAEHCRAAHDEGFRALVRTPEWSGFRSLPGMYEVVHEGHTER
jgi:heme-degrading monooxygenase HmoA